MLKAQEQTYGSWTFPSWGWVFSRKSSSRFEMTGAAFSPWATVTHFRVLLTAFPVESCGVGLPYLALYKIILSLVNNRNLEWGEMAVNAIVELACKTRWRLFYKIILMKPKLQFWLSWWINLNKSTLNPRLHSSRLNASPVYMPTNGLSRSSSIDAYVLYPPPRNTHRIPWFQWNKRSKFGCANCD